MHRPLVSVIIPSYNHAKYIRQTIDSVLSQEYRNLEVIVVDDGSTDDSLAILREYGNCIRMVSQKNQGQAAARNTGIQLAQGELIGFLDSDDLYSPGKIDEQVKMFEKDFGLSLVWTDLSLIDGDGKDLRLMKCPPPVGTPLHWAILEGNFICNATVMLRKTCFGQVGKFDTSIPSVADGDMWIRLLAAGHSFCYIAKPTIKYRVHAGNQSHDFLLMQKARDIMHRKALEELIRYGLITGKSEYELLASNFAKQFSFGAASQALRGAAQRGFSLQSLIYRPLYSILGSAPGLFVLAALSKLRKLL